MATDSAALTSARAAELLAEAGPNEPPAVAGASPRPAPGGVT
jgi:hypothetical protein